MKMTHPEVVLSCFQIRHQTRPIASPGQVTLDYRSLFFQLNLDLVMAQMFHLTCRLFACQ